MTRTLLALLLACAALVATATPARADTEWVLVLDNSTSMSDGSRMQMGDGTERRIGAQDPDRLSVIATLVFRAMMGPTDKLTILTFDSSGPGKHVVVPSDPAAIRGLQFDQLTFMVGPLQAARAILDRSTAATKVLVLATDGAPTAEPPATEPITPDQARALLGLDRDPAPFQLVSLALSNDPDTLAIQRQFLAPLGRLEPIDTPAQLVTAFTSVFAESIRSRPDTGRLAPGERHTFTVGKYVTDVYVAVATERTTGPIGATLTEDGAPVAVTDEGDAGCARKPCHAYQVFKARRDPSGSTTFELAVPRGGGAVAYGVILKYELGAEILSAPTRAKVGETIDVVARINWKGGTFNDPAFFGADGFAATLRLGDVEAPLTVKDDGTFAATLTVGGAPGPARLEARFANRWITLVGERDLTVEEWVPLELKVAPVDFGAWTGARGESRRCVDVDLAGSLNADKVPLEAIVAGLGGGYRLELPSPVTVTDGKVRACLVAPGCCEAAPAGATLTLRGADPHYHPGAVTVPLAYRVEPTPFLTCWWPYLAAAAGAIALTIIVVGFVRPRDFDKEEVLRLAKAEPALARASGRRLRDLPGGKRGFYRDARIALDGAGNAVRATAGAALILRAAKGDPVVTARGGLEEKDPRTRKFVPIDPAKGPIYLRRGVIYRCGEFVFRLG